MYDATNAVNSLLGQQPFQEYKSYFNAYAIFVASVEAGSDHPVSGGTLKNTYFNSSFDSYGISQLLTIPPNSYNGNYAQGQGKVDTLLAALMPEYDLAVMLVNDLEYGGSGGTTLITSVNLLGPEIVVHESGHSLGGLADEYDYGAPPDMSGRKNRMRPRSPTGRRLDGIPGSLAAPHCPHPKRARTARWLACFKALSI